MPTATPQHPAIREFLEALGIASDNAYEVLLILRANDPIVIEVSSYVNDRTIEAAVEEVMKYHLELSPMFVNGEDKEQWLKNRDWATAHTSTVTIFRAISERFKAFLALFKR